MPYRIAFCHPDLGLGGAERLVVDAAVELQSIGHEVTIYTTHHDPSRCFSETKDGTLQPIRVHGDWIPRHLFGKGHALLAYLRCMFLAIIICMDSWRGGEHGRYQVVFADQVSAVLPIFCWLAPSMKRLFYCHFPDMLLSKSAGLLKRLYRWPINALEEASTGYAHLTLVNSSYTLTVFESTFTTLASWMKPRILHPAVQLPDEAEIQEAKMSWRTYLPEDLAKFCSDQDCAAIFLSINRFERKKGLPLSLQALSHIQQKGSPAKYKLVLAGGYDERLTENREHLIELKNLARELGIEEDVYFITSFSDAEKKLLLSMCSAVVYTPENEHFGIVPLEAMSYGKLVIACDSGGPKESIVEGETGFLCAPRPEAFALAMQKVASERMNMELDAVRNHTEINFSRTVFGRKLDNIIEELVGE